MWVFPGGRVDPDDIPPDGDVIEAARHAAVREALEEADLVVDADALVPFSHWVPPPVTAKRFATWSSSAPRRRARSPSTWARSATIAGCSPPTRSRGDAEEIELAPPTWVTLHRLASSADVAEAMAEAHTTEPEFFETHIARVEGGAAALWEGDAGYESSDGDAPGARHRLWMLRNGWSYERT